MNEVPLGRVAMGARNELRVLWRPEGDERSPAPVVELARYRLSDNEWTYVGGTTLRVTCNIRELANAIDAAARFAERWQAEHPGER